jgi:glycosyltransferase involved in cell wall biosynthesis
MKTIMIYDAVCPKPYTTASLQSGGIGGTEATVLRICEELSKTHNVILASKGTTSATGEHSNLTYIPTDTPSLTTPHVVITLRDAGHYRQNQKLYPHATHYLWLHDVVAGDYRVHLLRHLHMDNSTPFKLLCVSEWHKTNVKTALEPILQPGHQTIDVVYNPLAEYCEFDFTPTTPKKLVFFSSPHKGLDYCIELFKYIHRMDPEFRLYIANPGYFPDKDGFVEGVINLGALPHKEVVNHVRSSLCLFYPQYTFPETFGLVMAEANAVGTPVIAHPVGAAAEILMQSSKQTLDCRNYKDVVDRVLSWADKDRPFVRADKRFKMAAVIQRWRALL